jgi:NADH:ubiquinone oxidoreductase subunit 6 (subunit J)
VSERLFPRTNSDFAYQYGYKNVDFSLSGVLPVLAFTWPLIFLFLARRRFGFRLRLFIQVLEVLVCCGTIYVIYAFTLSGFGARWLYGAYVGIIAVAVFTCAGLASWFVGTKESNQAMQRTAGRAAAKLKDEL